MISITQILCGINFGDSTGAKCDISTNSEALNLDLYEFMHFLKAEIHQINKIRAPEIAKMAVLVLLDSPEIDFR